MQLFKECNMTDDSGNSFELSLVGCKCIGAYVRNKKNQNQVIKLDFHFFYLFSLTLAYPIDSQYVYNTITVRFAGYGRKLGHNMIGDSSSS